MISGSVREISLNLSLCNFIVPISDNLSIKAVILFVKVFCKRQMQQESLHLIHFLILVMWLSI